MRDLRQLIDNTEKFITEARAILPQVTQTIRHTNQAVDKFSTTSDKLNELLDALMTNGLQIDGVYSTPWGELRTTHRLSIPRFPRPL